MASTLVLLLHLLLVSLGSASHNFGGLVTYSYKGKNPDGSFNVEMRTKDTFDGCFYSHYWACLSGQCGYEYNKRTGTIDSSTNSPLYTRQWCETESVSTRRLWSDKPFSMWASSCCWISTRNGVYSWTLMTSLDLGVRSDTKAPNKSPDIAILPFIRVPQNCPRRYELMAFDPDGDQVRCRYGTLRSVECSRCDKPYGFTLDEDSCTLTYQYSSSHTSVYAFEMVVEDFPRRYITLRYSDGSQTFKVARSSSRKKRGYYYYWPSPMNQTTTAQTTTWNPTTAQTTTWNPTTAQTTTMRTSGAPTTTWNPTTTQATTMRTSGAPTTTWNPMTTQATTMRTSGAPTTTWNPWATPTTSSSVYASPLSKLPLQFSFLVDPTVPSCLEGDYLPKLVDPTPTNKATIEAAANTEMQITVRGQARYSVINDLLVTGPLNITSTRISGAEFAIKWTPTSNELWDFYPICFAIESTSGSRIYHSEMRCVLVKVVKEVRKKVQTSVNCTETAMIVTVDKSTFPRIHEDHLRLNDAANMACRLTSNSTHVIGTIPLNACGTEVQEDTENLIFSNEITTFDNITDVITRKHLLEVQFSCQYRKRQNMSLAFRIHRDNVTVMEKGFGTFTYSFEFYTNGQFQTMEDPSLYPLEYEIGTRIYLQIEATTTVNNTELFVESCSAAPYDIPNYTPTYTIIKDGCNMDSTVITHPRSHPREFRFSLEAFKFIGLHDQVYISCQVMMCRAGDPNTRCSRGCIRPVQRNLWKREAASETGRHFISQGPLRFLGSAESSPGPALNLNLVFVAGCLLVALAMISALVAYKTKMSRVRYQPLPTQESDTAQ